MRASHPTFEPMPCAWSSLSLGVGPLNGQMSVKVHTLIRVTNGYERLVLRMVEARPIQARTRHGREGRPIGPVPAKEARPGGRNGPNGTPEQTGRTGAAQGAKLGRDAQHLVPFVPSFIY